MEQGVGYLVPAGDRTRSGHLIPRTNEGRPAVEIDAPRGSEKEREQLAALLGPNWQSGEGEMHSSDHYAALRTLWERGQRGETTGSLLIDDGRGFDGIPTVAEVRASHAGVMSRTLEAAKAPLPGEPGYGDTPLTAPEKGWDTEQWRVSCSKADKGIYANDARQCAQILAECDLIERGEAVGWAKNRAGKWRYSVALQIKGGAIADAPSKWLADGQRAVAFATIRALLDDLESMG